MTKRTKLGAATPKATTRSTYPPGCTASHWLPTKWSHAGMPSCD